MKKMDLNSLINPIKSFAKQSERVLNITHKPKRPEFQQIAYITAIGMFIIGGIGFVITMLAYVLRRI